MKNLLFVTCFACFSAFTTVINAQSPNQAFWSLSGNTPQSESFIGTFNNQPLILKANALEGLRLLPNGNIGIGTSSPSALLDINGNTIIRGSLFVNGIIELGDSSSFVLPQGISFSDLDIANNLRIGNNSLFLRNDNHIYTTEESGPIFIQSIGEQNTILNLIGGNVGIGTDDTKGYKLAVAGVVVAEEIVIKYKEDWPDFVFCNNYELMELGRLEAFIQKNKCLPEVPNANQVAETGISLGEMNAILLKKIEELTLYIINQQKEIDEIKNTMKIK
jgi:hypothetical protein